MRIAAVTLLIAVLAACGNDETRNEPAETPAEPPAAVPAEGTPEATPEGTTAATAEGRRIEVSVDKNGYAPSEITAQPNEKLILVFHRKDEDNCGGEVVFPATGEKKTLPVGTPTEVAVTAPASGKLEFACGMNMYKGAVVVTG